MSEPHAFPSRPCYHVPATPIGPGHGSYQLREHHYLAENYSQQSVAASAQAIGRPVGALKTYVSRHPELRKPKDP